MADTTWDLADTYWDAVGTVTWDDKQFLSSFAGMDGGAPQHASRRNIKKRLSEATVEEKKRLIKIYLTIDGEEIEAEKSVEKIDVTVEDVEVILKKVFNVKITF